jgi:hypothetical protein
MSFTPRFTRFHRLFQAFHLRICGFEFCKSVIHVNGTWLYDNYIGTLLIATAQYENKKIILIAFALVKDDMKESRVFFFMKNPRRHITPGQDVCMISDIHESIKSAYNNSLNGCHGSGLTHVYDIWHIRQYILRVIKDRDLKETISNMGNMCVCVMIFKNKWYIWLFFFNNAWYVMNIPKFE